MAQRAESTRAPTTRARQRAAEGIAAAFVFAVLALGPTSLQADGKSVVVLTSGNRLEGEVVKRTTSTVFLDVGHTILSLPTSAIRSVDEPEADPAPETEIPDPGKPAVRTDAIFFSADLEPGTVEDKASEVGPGVVQVQCLSKLGSGFIINAEKGYVVTNFHVVEGEQDIFIIIYVREENGSLRKLKLPDIQIVALNPFFDLALLEITDRQGAELQTAYLGDYSRVRAGDPVFAIGSPLGFERSVSEGIVSNRNRALQGYLLIQTTTAINPGNSGGPLFNERGEVIGVTSLKILGGESLGFAIPVHYVKDFLRNHEAYAFDKDNPNTGVRYLLPPPKRKPDAVESGADRSD